VTGKIAMVSRIEEYVSAGPGKSYKAKSGMAGQWKWG